MPATICPTITAENAHIFRTQMERIEPFANRIHVDVADGQLAPRQLLPLDQIWWSGNRTIDLHVMYRRPLELAPAILTLAPRLVIVHAEAEGDFMSFVKILHSRGLEIGVALLPATPVETIKPALGAIDHVLIFSGNLGYQGGSQADLSLLEKARTLRELKPALEIGWDGGINDQNARQLIGGGVDVLNVGGYIQEAEDAKGAYAKLEEVIT